MGQLTALLCLDLSENKLKSLPDPLKQLTNLTELVFDGNKLGDL
jgi:Leucine-rich repeat (LRR) protein